MGALTLGMALLILSTTPDQGQSGDVSILLLPTGDPGTAERIQEDSLLCLIAAGVEDRDGFAVLLPDTTLTREEGEQLLIRPDAGIDALATLSIAADDSTELSVAFLSPSDELFLAVSGGMYREEGAIALEEWPPDDRTGRQLLGNLSTYIVVSFYFSRGMWPELVEECSVYVEGLEGDDPHGVTGEASFLMVLASALFITGSDEDQVLDVYDRALEACTDSANVLTARAGLLMEIGDVTAALEDAGAALTIDSSNVRAWYLMGMLHARKGEKELALSEFQRVIELDSTQTMAYHEAYPLCMNTGDIERAVDLLDRVIILDPDDTYSFVCRAIVNEMFLYEFDDALRDYERAAELLESGDMGSFGSRYMALGATVLDSSLGPGGLLSFVEVMILGLERFLAYPEGSCGYHTQRGYYFSDFEDYEAAEADFSQALSMAGCDPEVYYDRALCRSSLGDAEGAADDLRSYLASGPSSSVRERMAEQMLQDLE